MLTYIGQFFDHDIDLVKGNTLGETMDIRIPQGDRYFDPEGLSTDDNPLYMTISRFTIYYLFSNINMLI